MDRVDQFRTFYVGMALAHDASGPASSEPAGIALRQAKRFASSDKRKLRVFISYSHDDIDFADQLTAAFDFSGFECFIDREGISGGEEWKRSLGNLISEADTVVFVLSPNSALSPICDWEVAEATRLHKRILPIVCRTLEGVSPPPRLRELNYIFFYKEPKASIGYASTPVTTFSWRGTRAVYRRTGCCQATIFSKPRPGQRVDPRVRPEADFCRTEVFRAAN